MNSRRHNISRSNGPRFVGPRFVGPRFEREFEPNSPLQLPIIVWIDPPNPTPHPWKSPKPRKAMSRSSSRSTTNSSAHRDKRQKRTREEPDFSEPTTFVTFIVGTTPNTKEFMVHEEVACFQSPVFDHAFNEDVGSTEFMSQIFRLENVTPRTFQMLVQWMYSNNIKLRQLQGEAPYFKKAEVTDDVKREEDMTMACLWVLAEKLKMPKLQNTLIQRIDDITNLCQQIPCATYHYIYRSTKEDSPLRKYTIDSATRYIDVKTLRDKEAEHPRPLLVVLAVGMLEREIERGVENTPVWARGIAGVLKRFPDPVRPKDYFVDVE